MDSTILIKHTKACSIAFHDWWNLWHMACNSDMAMEIQSKKFEKASKTCPCKGNPYAFKRTE